MTGIFRSSILKSRRSCARRQRDNLAMLGGLLLLELLSLLLHSFSPVIILLTPRAIFCHRQPKSLLSPVFLLCAQGHERGKDIYPSSYHLKHFLHPANLKMDTQKMSVVQRIWQSHIVLEFKPKGLGMLTCISLPGIGEISRSRTALAIVLPYEQLSSMEDDWCHRLISHSEWARQTTLFLVITRVRCKM